MTSVFNILLIEDDPSDAELIELQLSKSDVNIEFSVIDSESQLQQSLKEKWPDLVLSDYQLDTFTGEQALELVRTHSRELPFILISGYLDVKKAIQIMKAGASDFVMKDELERLNPVVKRELENYKQHLKLKRQKDVAVHDLAERVKEQKCLYKISSIDDQNHSIEEVLSIAVEYLPPGLQYPAITEAIIEYDGHSYQSEHYRETQWTLTGQNKTIENGPLIVKAVYLEEKPALDLGPFLKEEQYLIDSILDILSTKINRILDQRELQHKQDLLERSNTLAKIGHWEVDLVGSTIYWDQEVKKIHEVRDDYTPTLEEAINFYKKGKHREKIQETFTKAIEDGESYDVVLKIITGKGKERWIRTIGKPVFKDGRCVRVYGSFQDIDKRKRAQFESERNRLLLETISEQTEAAIWVRDSESRQIFVNKEWKRIFGLENQHVLGKTVFEVLDEATATEFRNHDEQVLSSDRSFKYEERVSTLQGDRYYLTNMFPLVNIPGVGKGVGGIATDITERKNYVSQLKQKRERLEEAQRIGQIGDWYFNVKTGEIFWSDQMFEIYERDPNVGPPGYEELRTYYPEDADKHDTLINQAIEQAIDYEFDMKTQTEKGNKKYIHAEGFPETDEAGTVIRLHGIVQDITARKEKELELAANQRQVMAIVDNIEGVLYRYIVRPDGTDEMVYISEGIERLLGVTSDQARESTDILWRLIDKRDLDRFTKSVEESAKTLEPWYEQYRIETPQGEKKWIRGSGHPIQLEDGTILWDTLITDISQEVQQQQTNEALVQEVHHRVKNNLAIIIGFLHLQIEELDENQSARLHLERAMTRIFSISEVHKLLYDSSNMVDIPVKEYLDHLTDHIVNTIKIDAEIMIDVNVDGIQMNVNEITPLGMLMNELLTNSVKYAFKNDEKGYIQIHISQEDSSYQVSYRDSGSGISQTDLEEMQGAGLSIVRMLLNQLEAEYQLLNDDGFRLDFTFNQRIKGAHGNYQT